MGERVHGLSRVTGLSAERDGQREPDSVGPHRLECLTIFGHCRRAMKRDGRLLLIEMVLPPGNAPHPGKMLDRMMLVGPGGQERTAGEYGQLLAKAGFRLNRIVPTESAASVVEALPA
jgi:hypothetical protein